MPRLSSVACGFLILTAISSSPLLADMVTLDAFNGGYFRNDGRHITGYFNTGTGFSNSRRYNSFFVFDLSSLSGTVDSANLRFNLAAYDSTSPSLSFTVFDVSASAAELEAQYLGSSPEGAATHIDLGSGNAYANHSISASDVGSGINLSLNATALQDIQNQLDGIFAVGISIPGPDSGHYLAYFGEETILFAQLDLSLTSLPDPEPEPEPEPENPSAPGPGEIVPEPGTSLAISIALLGQLSLRNSRRRKRANL